MTGAMYAIEGAFLNSFTDFIGIGAAVVAVVLLLRADSVRSAGLTPAKSLKGAAALATVLAVVIIGGRFSLLPDASSADASADTVSASGGESLAVAVPLQPLPQVDSPSDVAIPRQGIEPSPVSPDPTVESGDLPAEYDDSAATSTTVTTAAAPTTVTTTTTAVTTTTERPSTATDSDTSDDADGRAPPAADADGGAATPAASATTRTVVEGDSFWAIADDVVSDSLGHDATAAEIAPYWQQLLQQNADNLPQPGNPDLIVPGMTLQLPPMGPAPG